MADVIGELRGERFTRHLLLIRVVGFLRFGVIWPAVGIGRRGNDERISRCVLHRRAIAGRWCPGSGFASSANAAAPAPSAICAQKSAIRTRTIQVCVSFPI